MTSGGWRLPTVPIWGISTKCISLVILSVLVHETCVLNNKKLNIAYFFSFGKTPKARSEKVPRLHVYRDVLGTYSEREFKDCPSNRFLRKVFFTSWCLPSAYQTLQNQNKLKTYCVLFWSYCGPRRLDQNRTIRARDRGFVCQLGSRIIFTICEWEYKQSINMPKCLIIQII